MGNAITGTLVGGNCTELAGHHKLFVLTATIGSASDAIALATDVPEIKTVLGAWPVIETGLDANFATIQASFTGASGAVIITLTSTESDGTASTTDWGTVRLLVLATV